MALIASSALTAFLLITGVVVASRLGGSTAEPPVAEPTAISAQTEQLYRQRLDESNTILQEAYNRIGSLEAENATLRQAPRPAEAARPGPASRAVSAGGVLISAEQAAQLAIQVVGGGKVRSVELEHEHGRSVYEVKIGRSEVKVDAATGETFAEEDD
jgi:hypothetical protein